jgi:hypothetical protein
MKCQFCKQRCALIKKNDSDFSPGDMNWVCTRHPLRVIHVVSVKRYTLRRDHNIQGEQRLWNNTYMIWEDGKQRFRANFWRFKGQPNIFVLEAIHLATDLNELDKYDEYADDVFKLESHPKEITPENIVNKMKTYRVFS